MNFFDDDFGLESTPTLNKKRSNSSIQKGHDTMSKKSDKKSQFDEIMDDLLGKEEKKNKKKSEFNIAPFSSQNLEPMQPIADFKKTQKWSISNIEADQNYAGFSKQSIQPNISRQSKKYEDQISEDNRSHKSGVTGKVSLADFDFANTAKNIDDHQDNSNAIVGSMRSMMKPPLRKRQSKQPSFVAEEPSIFRPSMRNIDSFNNLETFSISDNKISDPFIKKEKEDHLNKQEKPNFKIFDLNDSKNIHSVSPNQKEKIVEKQKIVYVKEDQSQLKKQFDNQNQMIKESFQRQIKILEENIKKQMEENEKMKHKLLKENSLSLEEEKSRYQKLLKENNDRMKDVYEWELKKKCEAYQMEIDKLKSVSKLSQNIIQAQNNSLVEEERQKLILKEKQLGAERKHLEDLKLFLNQRQKSIQSNQKSIESYRIKEENRVQHLQRQFYENQNELKKQEIESKHTLNLQKQSIAKEQAQLEFQIIKIKESLNLERQQLRLERQLFEKEKQEYENFNKNVVNEYRNKIKQLEKEREQLSRLEIDLYKKINTVEMIGVQKNNESAPRLSPHQRDFIHSYRNKSLSRTQNNPNYKENQRNRINSQLETKVNETKDRFTQMENWAKQNAIESEEIQQKSHERTNLQSYVNGLNKQVKKR